MTLLRTPDEPTATPERASCAEVAYPANPERGRTRRSLAALVAVVGLLLWASLTAPRMVAFMPQMAGVTSAATSWINSTLVGASPSSSGLALSGSRTPQACSTSSASAFGSNLVVPQNAWVCGDALVMGGNLDVQGRIQGSAQAIGGNVTISGEVDGDVTAVGGNITVKSGAVTHGKLDAVGGHVILEPGVRAQTVTTNTLEQNWSPGPNGSWTWHDAPPAASAFWLGLLFWVSAAIGLSAFVPEAVGHVRYTIARRFLYSGVAGAVIGVVGLVVGVALLLTCIGIPVTILIGLALWLAWVIGTVAFASWLGASLLRGLRHNYNPSLLVSSLLGVVILCLLKSAPVVGTVVSVMVGCVGLGAAGLTLLSARRVSYAHLRW
ncbi:MAG TPA: polymer-forming cytoskeletal protein [Ktedonobacterales bacterium]